MGSPLRDKQNAKTLEFLTAIFGDDEEAKEILGDKETAKIKKQDARLSHKLIPSEADEARKLTQWLRFNKFVFLHIPNERKASARQIAELKRQGLQKGAPDYLIFCKNGLVAIELKRASKSKSRISPEQMAFIDSLNGFEYCKAFVAYGAVEAIEFLKRLK